MSGPFEGATPEERAVLAKFGFEVGVAYAPVGEGPGAGISAMIESLGPEGMTTPEGTFRTNVGPIEPRGVRLHREPVHLEGEWSTFDRDRLKREAVRQAVLAGQPITMTFEEGGVVPCGECRWWDDEDSFKDRRFCRKVGEPDAKCEIDDPHCVLLTAADFWCEGGEPPHEHRWEDVTTHEQTDRHFLCGVEGCDATKKEPRA